MTGQIKKIDEKLLFYLRNKLHNSMIEYEEPLVPLDGGCETHMYRFKLKGVPKELSIPLVLRVFPPSYGTKNAVLEKTVQNVLAKEGVPVAHTYFMSTDMTILGGSFLIMAFLSGNLMLTAPIEIIPGMLAIAHASLHKLKGAALMKQV